MIYIKSWANNGGTKPVRNFKIPAVGLHVMGANHTLHTGCGAETPAIPGLRGFNVVVHNGS